MEASSHVVSREEFTTAIGDVSAKIEALVMTMPQLVQGTAPARGDGQESGSGRHTAPGGDRGRIDHAPNTGGVQDWPQRRSGSSAGDATRESAHGEQAAHHVNPLISRTPRLRQFLRTRAGHLRIGVEEREKGGGGEGAARVRCRERKGGGKAEEAEEEASKG